MSSVARTQTIEANLEAIRKRMAAACARASRVADEVKLVAISKTKPATDVQAAVAAGQQAFGENKVQELRDKQPEVPSVEWHMVGNLQRNKVKYIVEFVDLIHSLDSIKLLKEIEKRAGNIERRVHCLVQVNISDEAQKGGVEPAELPELLQAAQAAQWVQIDGLMGMAEFTDDEATIRRQFRRLAQLRDQHAPAFASDRVQLKELSMGMTGDFEIAIEEGATIIRVGSAIFGERHYS